jgi:RNA recognition motif-containing protein
MAKNIYIGNLKWEVGNDDLLQLFSQFGKVSHAQVITNKETGRPRGFGFVVMENDEEAARAIEQLNGIEHQGRPLTVNEAKPKEERPRSAPRGGGGPRTASFRGAYGGTDRGRRY